MMSLLKFIALPFCFLGAEPFQRRVGSETLQPFHGTRRGTFRILQTADGIALRIGTLWNPTWSGGSREHRSACGACIFGIGFQHCDDGAARLGAYLYESEDGAVVSLDAFLAEQFGDAPVGGAAFAFFCDELPVRFEFGGRVSHGKTLSNKPKRQSNRFEPCLSLCEAGIFERKHCLGKMSVLIMSCVDGAQNEVWSCVGTGTDWKGGRRCFG